MSPHPSPWSLCRRSISPPARKSLPVAVRYQKTARRPPPGLSRKPARCRMLLPSRHSVHSQFLIHRQSSAHYPEPDQRRSPGSYPLPDHHRLPVQPHRTPPAFWLFPWPAPALRSPAQRACPPTDRCRLPLAALLVRSRWRQSPHPGPHSPPGACAALPDAPPARPCAGWHPPSHTDRPGRSRSSPR